MSTSGFADLGADPPCPRPTAVRVRFLMEASCGLRLVSAHKAINNALAAHRIKINGQLAAVNFDDAATPHFWCTTRALTPAPPSAMSSDPHSRSVASMDRANPPLFSSVTSSVSLGPTASRMSASASDFASSARRLSISLCSFIRRCRVAWLSSSRICAVDNLARRFTSRDAWVACRRAVAITLWISRPPIRSPLSRRPSSAARKDSGVEGAASA